MIYKVIKGIKITQWKQTLDSDQNWGHKTGWWKFGYGKEWEDENVPRTGVGKFFFVTLMLVEQHWKSKHNYTLVMYNNKCYLDK